MNETMNYGGSPEPGPGCEVILHPAWVERVSVDGLAARLLEWDRWLGNRTTRTGRMLFVAEPVTLVNIIPQRSGRA